MHVGVKRCTGEYNGKLKKDDELERMLKASWDYQEAKYGWPHPLKEGGSIQPLDEKIRKGT